jgi:hypothetical protein
MAKCLVESRIITDVSQLVNLFNCLGKEKRPHLQGLFKNKLLRFNQKGMSSSKLSNAAPPPATDVGAC